MQAVILGRGTRWSWTKQERGGEAGTPKLGELLESRTGVTVVNEHHGLHSHFFFFWKIQVSAPFLFWKSMSLACIFTLCIINNNKRANLPLNLTDSDRMRNALLAPWRDFNSYKLLKRRKVFLRMSYTVLVWEVPSMCMVYTGAQTLL